MGNHRRLFGLSGPPEFGVSARRCEGGRTSYVPPYCPVVFQRSDAQISTGIVPVEPPI